MKILKSVTTFAIMTATMGFASISNAAPATTAPATTTAVTTTTAHVAQPAAKPVTTKTAMTTTVKQSPKETVVKKVTTNKSGFKCKDGSLSKAKSTRGACSGHGGIAR